MTETAQPYLIEVVDDFEREGIWPGKLEMDVTPGPDGNPVRWEIKTKDAAAWALRKMAKIKAGMDENEIAAVKEIQRIVAWKEAENAKLQDSLNFFEFLLQGYFLESRKADPTIKTIKLPHGALKMRTQQPEYTYEDDQLLAWAHVNLPTAIVVKESVAKQQVKDHIKETGEIPDGVSITERPEKFSIEVI